MEFLLDTTLLTARLFDIKIINTGDFIELLMRFILNFSVCVAIARGIYYPITKRKDYLFTYVLFSVIIFFLCHLLASVKLELGFALGMFAVFGIIRYRTDAIRIKEMTYLFIIIGVSTINALANKKVSHVELLFTNVSIFTITYLFEKVWLSGLETSKLISYEKIELIKPENNEKLITDLRERTGLEINRVKIEKIDFLRDTAQVRVYYKEGNP